MSTSFTLATLKSWIQEMVEDAGTDLSGNLNDIIKRAEDQVVVDLDLEIFRANDTVSLSSGSQTANLPSGFLELKSMFYTASSSRTYLERRSYEYCIDYWPSTSSTSAPLYWAQISHATTAQIFVAPTPDAIYTCTGRGIKRPTSLVTDTSGTWLSQNCGTLLANACLVATQLFQVADERIPIWRDEYGAELQRKLFELRHLRAMDFELGQFPAPAPGREAA